MGSAVAGRAARVVVFVLNVRVASRVVAAVCVGDVHGTESFKTRPWLPSESPALESYEKFGCNCDAFRCAISVLFC